MPGRYEYSSFEEACHASKTNKAIGKIRITINNQPVSAEIVKPLTGDGWVVWEGCPGAKIRWATSREIDSIKKWDDF